jgi:hypothetical protein
VSGISPQQKKDPRKKEKEKRKREKEKKERGLKRRGETSYEEAPCFKRRKEEKRG